jgi:hypothetical protein
MCHVWLMYIAVPLLCLKRGPTMLLLPQASANAPRPKLVSLLVLTVVGLQP